MIVSPNFSKESMKAITKDASVSNSILTFPKEYLPNLPPGTNITIAGNDTSNILGQFVHLLGDYPSENIKNKIQSLLTLNGSISANGKRDTSIVTTLQP